MVFVIDASVTIAWLMPDEADDVANNAYRRLRDGEALVPSLWWYEVRNVLIANERRKRVSQATVDRLLVALARLPIGFDHTPDEPALLGLARKFQLTVYDAAYLELALRREAPLASLDRALKVAARASGVACIGDA